MLRKALAVSFLVFSLAFLIYAAYSSFRPNINTPEKPLPVDKMIELTGVIRTSGLLSDGKKELSIPDEQGDFQLIVGVGEEYYFILGPRSNMEGLVGKCVFVSVPEKNIVQPGSRLNQNVAYEYPKTLLIDESSRIDIQDFSKCKPYTERTRTYPKEDFRVLTGTLQREVRPAEDIIYDYTLYVPEGFKEPQNASGIPDIEWHTAVIIPANNLVWKDFELYMGKEVTLEGYSEWGYAETRHHVITKVTPK